MWNKSKELQETSNNINRRKINVTRMDVARNVRASKALLTKAKTPNSHESKTPFQCPALKTIQLQTSTLAQTISTHREPTTTVKIVKAPCTTRIKPMWHQLLQTINDNTIKTHTTDLAPTPQTIDLIPAPRLALCLRIMSIRTVNSQIATMPMVANLIQTLTQPTNTTRSALITISQIHLPATTQTDNLAR